MHKKVVKFNKRRDAYWIKYSSSYFGRFVIFFFHFNKSKIATPVEVPPKTLRSHAPHLSIRHWE